MDTVQSHVSLLLAVKHVKENIIPCFTWKPMLLAQFRPPNDVSVQPGHFVRQQSYVELWYQSRVKVKKLSTVERY